MMARVDKQEKTLLVLKIGTSTLIQDNPVGFSLSKIGKLIDAVCDLRDAGYQVILVSSGAVGAGMIHLNLQEKPIALECKQAVSAVGQCRIMRLYEDLFGIRNQKVGQLIVTRTDLIKRIQFNNFKNTLRELLILNVLPIINENDSVATAQLRFGDNDTLAAYVAVAIEANWLFLLTDVDCLYTMNPRLTNSGKPILIVSPFDDVYSFLDREENKGSQWGSGGIRTKIIAAKIAAATGIHTALCHGEHPERVLHIIEYSTKYLIKTFQTQALPHIHYNTDDASASSSSILRKGSFIPSIIHQPFIPYNRALKSDVIPGLELNKNCLLDVHTQDINSEDFKESVDMYTIDHYEWDNLKYVTSLKNVPFIGTIFTPSLTITTINEQQRWILSLPVGGKLYMNIGTAKALIIHKSSLFALGIIQVEGIFYEGEAALLCYRPHLHNTFEETSYTDISPLFEQSYSLPSTSVQPRISYNCRCQLTESVSTDFPLQLPCLNEGIAQCLINFSSDEIRKIKGLKSDMFKSVLGYDCDNPEVAHHHNIILVRRLLFK